MGGGVRSQQLIITIAMGNNITRIISMVLRFRNAIGNIHTGVDSKGFGIVSRGICIHNRSIGVHCRSTSIYNRGIVGTISMGINFNNITGIVAMVIRFRNTLRINMVNIIFDFRYINAMAIGSTLIGVASISIIVHGRSIGVHNRSIGVHCRSIGIHCRGRIGTIAMGINFNNITGIIAMVIRFRNALRINIMNILLYFRDIFSMVTIVDNHLRGIIAIGSSTTTMELHIRSVISFIIVNIIVGLNKT
jgi:hypothetical protein